MKATQATKEFRPCLSAIKFLKGKSITQAWNECPYGVWMLWILARLKPSSMGYRNSTEEFKQAALAGRDTSITGSPADRIRSVITGRQVATLVRKYCESK